MKSIRRPSGLSIIELLVSMGILAIIMAGMMTYMTSQMKETKALSEKLGVLDLEKFLIASLTDGSVCSYMLTQPTLTFDDATIGGPAAPSITKNNIPASGAIGAPAIISVNSPISFTNPSVIVSAITFKNFQRAGVADQYLADLSIDFNTSALIRALRPIYFKLKINTRPGSPLSAKEIVSCLYGGTASGCVWDNTGGVLTESCANVGIGTSTPGDLFQVAGPLSSSATSGTHTPATARLDYCSNCGTTGQPASRISAISAGNGVLGEFRLDLYSANNSLSKMPFFINSSGNVGIGSLDPKVNLDVKGGIRPGSAVDVTVCGSGLANGEGTTRYHYPNHEMQFCNGTSWVPFIAAGGAVVTNTVVNCPFANNPGLGSPTTAGCQIDCPAGYTVTGGGAYMGCVNIGGGSGASPSGNGYLCFVNVGSCSCGTMGDGCASTCYAVCSKIN